MSIDVISVLQQMLKSDYYFLTTTWIQPVGGHGLDQTLLEVLFKVIKDLSSTTTSDVRAIFMRPDHRYNDVYLELASGGHEVRLHDLNGVLRCHHIILRVQAEVKLLVVYQGGEPLGVDAWMHTGGERRLRSRLHSPLQPETILDKMTLGEN